MYDNVGAPFIGARLPCRSLHLDANEWRPYMIIRTID